MKILKTIFYALGVLLALLIALITLSAFQPKLSENLADFLYSRGKDADVQSTVSENSADVTNSNTAYDAGGIENGIVSTIPKEEQYIAPKESEISLPEKVAGKNGYQPVKEDAKEIEEAEGEKLAETLGYGETGEGLEFDTRFNPYYGMLNSTLQSLYRQIYANALALNDTFAPIEDVSLNELKNVFMAVVGDHPELFWLDTAFGCKYLPNGQCIEINLQFNDTATNLDNNKQNFENSANQILQGATNLGTDYEKEVYVHDVLINRIEYNLDAPLNQSAYSALVSGQTVCAGYARAYQYLMQKLTIPCYYCTGFAGENHAWNIISLDDGYYNVDTTWDDTNPNTYDYFNKSDTDFSTNHMRKDLSVYLPACNGESYRNLEATDTVEPVAAEPTTAESMAEEPTTTDPMTVEPMTENGRSLEDVGFTQEDVINSLADYYTDCYDQVMKNGIGSYQFQNVISGNDVYAQIYEDYLNDNYNSGYANRAVADLGANSFVYEIQGEKLQDGYLLLSHNMLIQ